MALFLFRATFSFSQSSRIQEWRSLKFFSRVRACVRVSSRNFSFFSFSFLFLFSFLYKGVWGKPFFSLFFSFISFLSFPGKTSEEMGITSEEMRITSEEIGITSEEMGITSEMNNAGLRGSAWFYK